MWPEGFVPVDSLCGVVGSTSSFIRSLIGRTGKRWSVVKLSSNTTLYDEITFLVLGTYTRYPFWCCGIHTKMPRNPFCAWWRIFNLFVWTCAIAFCTTHGQNKTLMYSHYLSLSHLRVLFCTCVLRKATAHVETKTINMRHQAQKRFVVSLWVFHSIKKDILCTYPVQER